jgi:hypothetical protein
MKATAIGLAALVVAGCASLDQKGCETASWSELGYRDGARGYTAGRLADYHKDCSEHGVAPDDAVYNEGRARGLREYCTPENGLREGKAGSGYNNVCPAGLDAAFVKNHKLGGEIRDLNNEIVRKRSEIERREKRLEKEKNDDDRRALRNEIRELDRDVARLRRSIDSLEAVGVIR